MEIAYIKIEGQEQYKQLARALRDAGRGDLQRKLVRNIRREGDPALRAAQSRFRSVDVQVIDPPGGAGGGGSTGLRARVAAATRISVLGSGISVRVEPKKVDPRYGKTLTYGIDGLGKWRHPVFGNRNAWVGQRGEEVFFTTLSRYESRWRAAVIEAMEEIAAQIGG